MEGSRASSHLSAGVCYRTFGPHWHIQENRHGDSRPLVVASMIVPLYSRGCLFAMWLSDEVDERQWL